MWIHKICAPCGCVVLEITVWLGHIELWRRFLKKSRGMISQRGCCCCCSSSSSSSSSFYVWVRVGNRSRRVAFGCVGAYWAIKSMTIPEVVQEEIQPLSHFDLYPSTKGSKTLLHAYHCSFFRVWNDMFVGYIILSIVIFRHCNSIVIHP